jgi:N-acetylglucosaminyldiphosphoundecaprenol N-acetyl-beta-D-mannosaminyltransferase
MQTIDFLDLPLIAGNVEDIANWITLSAYADSKQQTPVLVTHVNANNYYLLCQNPSLYEHLKSEAHILFDGIGMKIAASLLGLGWLPDLNGTDLFPLVIDKLANNSVPLYFLGANELVVKKAVQRIRRWNSKICIVGHSNGYFRETDEDEIVNKINASGAQVLVVGRGFPLQEAFSLRQRSRLKVALIWNVGGLFDFMSGYKRRAPLWMRQLRLEWLFRLTLEPQRLWRRTFIVAPWLAKHIFAQRHHWTRQIRSKEV